MSELSDLRAVVLERDQGCVWPACTSGEQLQLAHLKHRGMGGSKTRNTEDNCVMLCILHHNCLDGRTGLGILRLELSEMLKHAAHIH